MKEAKARALIAALRRRDDGTLELLSPTVGYYREAPEPGALLGPGQRLGALEVLGEVQTLITPEGAHGRVLSEARAPLASRPVGYGDVLLRLDPSAAPGLEERAAEEASGDALENVFRAPMAGRFYVRPAPNKPAFIEPGRAVETGETVCLIEIMKTFHRVTYGGPGLPARCRVTELLLADGDDVEQGTPLFRYEAE